MASSHRLRSQSISRKDPAASRLHLEWYLQSAGRILLSRYGPMYDQYLHQSRTAILMTMVAREITSPFIAAVHLGVAGELARLMGSEDDAFAVLIQAALQVYSNSSPETAV